MRRTLSTEALTSYVYECRPDGERHRDWARAARAPHSYIVSSARLREGTELNKLTSLMAQHFKNVSFMCEHDVCVRACMECVCVHVTVRQCRISALLSFYMGFREQTQVTRIR